MAKKKPKDTLYLIHSIHHKQQEHSYDYVPVIYDSLPYLRDSDVCNQHYLEQNPVRVIHNYTMAASPCKICDGKKCTDENN